jgi:hypothetical protein
MQLNVIDNYSHLEIFVENFRTFYNMLIHIYNSRFIPEGVAEASQIFLQDAHESYEEYCRRDRW